MTTLSDWVERTELTRALQWAAEIEDFQEHHAVDGLVVANGFRPDAAEENPDAVLLLGLVIALWFWIDDRSDKYLLESRSPVDFPGLQHMVQRDVDPKTLIAHNSEERYIAKLACDLWAVSKRKVDYDWWRSTSVRVLMGMEAEEQASRAGRSMPYSESVEHGFGSTGVVNILAAASLLHGIDRAGRHEDVRLCDLERHFAMYQRLLNDINSAPKERQEGRLGRAGNSILELERSIGLEKAETFAREQLAAYQTLVQHNIKAMGRDDRFAQVVQNAMNAISRWYGGKPVRYEAR